MSAAADSSREARAADPGAATIRLAIDGRLQERLPQVGSVSVVDLAAVVAVHGGPGTIGVAVCPHGPGHGAPRAH